MKRRHPAGVRLDLAKPVRVEPAQPGHPVLAAAALEFVEPGKLALVARHDQLAAPLEGDAALPQYSYRSRAPSTQSRALSDPGA